MPIPGIRGNSSIPSPVFLSMETGREGNFQFPSCSLVSAPDHLLHNVLHYTSHTLNYGCTN